MDTMDSSTFHISSTKRIAKNTLMLYFRQIISMLVSLYTVRIVLATLGTEDYGVYNVVGGVVTMFGFLSGAMATASQRFFSFELGRGDTEKLKKTFSVMLCIYLFLILIIVFLAETIGLWFMNHKLVIPLERMTAARWVYQFSILSFALSLINSPYMAAIIAHENMNIYAYMSIVEAVLKLVIVFVLRILPYDKLIIYGFLVFVVGCINRTLYHGFCKRHYEECMFKPVWDKAMFKEIASYSGWNLFGNIAAIFKNQGINILLNQFFGPVVNASRAIALQVNTAASSFCQNFSTALQPQITKNYAQKNYNETFSLVFRGCRFTHFLMLIFTVPLILNMEYVLRLWLGREPGDSVIFTKLVLIATLVRTPSYAMATANQATGKIKYYQMLIGFVAMMTFPASYVLLKLEFEAWIVFVVNVFSEFFALVIRTLFLYQIPTFSFLRILKSVYLRIFFVDGIVMMLFYFWKLETISLVSFFGNVFVEVLITGILIFFIGFTNNERKMLFKAVKNKVNLVLGVKNESNN